MNDRSTGLRVFVPMLGVGLLTGFGASTATAQDCGVTRDLALVNGQIYQMNEADSTASSVLIKNGRVAAMNPTLDDDACVEIGAGVCGTNATMVSGTCRFSLLRWAVHHHNKRLWHIQPKGVNQR